MKVLVSPPQKKNFTPPIVNKIRSKPHVADEGYHAAYHTNTPVNQTTNRGGVKGRRLVDTAQL